MSDCRTVAAFLTGVASRASTPPIAPPDLSQLQQLGLIDLLTPDQRTLLEQQVAQLQAAQVAIEQEEAKRQEQSGAVDADTRRTHSILFHLQGVDKEEAEVDRLHAEQEALQAIEADLAKREADFQQLLVKKSELELMMPFDGQFIAVTTAGRVALRDLNVGLYRLGDTDFSSYWAQSRAIDTELAALSAQAATFHQTIGASLPNVDPSYLWAVAIGLAKQHAPADVGPRTFVEAYNALGRPVPNDENRLLAAEVLTGLSYSVADSVQALETLMEVVMGDGVPEAAAAGVAAVLLAGRRGDGSYATDALAQFLRLTPSYESAALLAIVNKPYNDLATTFGRLKALFASWNYPISEDTELSAAYLAVSDLPAETVGSKMAILARGVGAYLEYPLVAAAVLASIPVLEANETLNLLEKTYEILGQQTGPVPQAELITLAVRLMHGVDVRGVGDLDPTQTTPANYPSFSYPAAAARLWIPVYVAHGYYFSTFSGIGGFHPGHVHAIGGGGWGGGFGG